MCVVFAFMNLKGGVGKTVLAANLAREIAVQRAKRILLVDLDPQCSMSHLFDEADKVASVEKSATALEAIWPTGAPADLLKKPKVLHEDKPGLFNRTPVVGKVELIPGSMEIYKVITNAGVNVRQQCIQNFKDFVRAAATQYDYIVVDTNPSTNIGSLCALAAADFVVAPMKMDIFSVRGIIMLQEIFGEEFECVNREAKRVIGIWNMMDAKLRHSNKTSAIEKSLHSANKGLFSSAIGPRIYETS
jgi:chromosome partitioning protein